MPQLPPLTTMKNLPWSAHHPRLAGAAAARFATRNLLAHNNKAAMVDRSLLFRRNYCYRRQQRDGPLIALTTVSSSSDNNTSCSSSVEGRATGSGHAAVVVRYKSSVSFQDLFTSTTTTTTSSGNNSEHKHNKLDDGKQQHNVGDVGAVQAATFHPERPELQNKEGGGECWRPMTSGERMRHFPGAVRQLYWDCVRYKNIRDASRTRLNAWTIHHPARRRRKRRDDNNERMINHDKEEKQEELGEHFEIHENEPLPGRIPRRQHEQQRRVRSDVLTMAPLVALWIPPIIGYLPMIFAITAPRQVLSRQFHNTYEVYHYAELAYKQSYPYYRTVQEAFWNIATVERHYSPPPHLKDDGAALVEQEQADDDYDAAGPVVDAIDFHSVFAAHRSGLSHELLLRRGVLASVDAMPREYVVNFALAIGINQYLPSRAGASFATRWLCPKPLLAHVVRRAAIVVYEDDCLLLRERCHHHENKQQDQVIIPCACLTDEEVLDGCSMRGLPVNVSVMEMRVCLRNHLRMIASVKEKVSSSSSGGGSGGGSSQAILLCPESFGLFTLHLSIIRDYLKKNKQTTTT